MWPSSEIVRLINSMATYDESREIFAGESAFLHANIKSTAGFKQYLSYLQIRGANFDLDKAVIEARKRWFRENERSS